MAFDPSPIQTLALWSLFFTDKAPPMQSKLAPRLDPRQRKELVDAGLITLKKKGRASHVFLTEKAWAWAAAHLDAPFSHTKNAAPPLASLLATLKKYMDSQGIPLVEILNPAKTPSLARKEFSSSHGRQPDGRQTDAPKAARPQPSPEDLAKPIPPGQKTSGSAAFGDPKERLEQRVKRAYLDASGGRWDVRVRMADIRKKLVDIPPTSLDAILRKMQLDQKLVLYPLDEPSEISPEDDAAAVVAGGRKNHILYMTATKFV